VKKERARGEGGGLTEERARLEMGEDWRNGFERSIFVFPFSSLDWDWIEREVLVRSRGEDGDWVISFQNSDNEPGFSALDYLL
jgi:hypothetical protein